MGWIVSWSVSLTTTGVVVSADSVAGGRQESIIRSARTVLKRRLMGGSARAPARPVACPGLRYLWAPIGALCRRWLRRKPFRAPADRGVRAPDRRERWDAV